MLRRTDAPRRLLTTVMFTDIVGSTRMAADLGDRRWRQLVARHHSMVRRALKKHEGRELDTAGDGFFASFDQPGRAIACAVELTGSLRNLGIEIRAGINMGEVEVIGPKVGGIAVHVGSRVMSMAGPGEVWVSSTVRDLMSGSDVRFDDRGVHELKGVPAQLRLYSVQFPPASEPIAEEDDEDREPSAEARSRVLRRRGVVVAGIAALVAVAVVVGLLIGGGGNGSLSPSSPPPVGLAEADRLVRVSQAGSAANQARIAPLKAGIDPSAVAVGEGSIWVANRGNGTVSRINPVTNGSTTIKVGSAPYLIAVGEGSVWTVNRLSESVSRIDPGTDKVVATVELKGPGFPSSIAVGEGAVWVGVNPGFDPSVEPPAVNRIDPRTNRMVTTIELASVDVWPVVTTGGGAVWAIGNSGRLFRIDPGTNEAREVASLGTTAAAMTFASGDLWIASAPGGILRVDPATGGIEATVPGGGSPEEFRNLPGQCVCVQLGMAFADGIIWVTGKLNGTIDRIVAIDNTALESINVGQTPTGVAVGYGSVWVTVDATS